MREKEPLKEDIKLSSRLWLGAADCMSTTLCNIVTGGGLTFFYVNYFGLDPGWSSLCWLLFGIWNAVNDPLFGYLSDKTKSKLGRRRPYIRYGSIIITVIFIFTWIPMFVPGADGQMFAQMLISLVLYDTLYTAVATSLYVMPYEMAVTNQARSKIILVKVIFGLAALSVPLVLLAELQNILSASLASFQLLMTVIGLAAGCIMFFSTFFYQEKPYIQQEQQYPFLQSLKTCFRNKSFLVFELISFSVTYIQTALMMGLGYYFGSSGVSYLPCYAAMLAGIFAGMALWTKPGMKWGVSSCIVRMCLIFGAGLAIMLVFGDQLWAGMFGFFCSGIGFAGGMLEVPLMNGDVIDYDESQSGLRREGMYAGVNSFICKPAISIANAVFPMMIVHFGYDANLSLSSQSASAVFGIRFSWLIVSICLLFFCAWGIAKWYPLKGREWQAGKDRLAREHAEKQKEFEQEALAREKQA